MIAKSRTKNKPRPISIIPLSPSPKSNLKRYTSHKSKLDLGAEAAACTAYCMRDNPEGLGLIKLASTVCHAAAATTTSDWPFRVDNSED
jgi:hypothetical protein